MERLIVKELQSQAILIGPEEQKTMIDKMRSAQAADNQEEANMYRDLLLKSIINLVIKIANKYVNRGTDVGDLIQEGFQGALRAISMYDSAKDCNLSTYAYSWIQSFVIKAVIRNRSCVSISDRTLERMATIYNAENDYELETGVSGETASDEEISARTKLSVAMVKEIRGFKKLAVTTNIGALSSAVEEDDRRGDDEIMGSLSKKDTCDVETAGEEKLELHEMLIEERRKVILRILKNYFTETQYEFAKLRWGLREDGTQEDCLTLTDVGKRLGFSRERARRIEATILKRMRTIPEASEWKAYFEEQYREL